MTFTFKELGSGGRTFKFSKDNLPNTIYTAKFFFAKSDMIDAIPVRRMKIFENVKYIGHPIVDEDKF